VGDSVYEQKIEELFADQVVRWPLLGKGIDALTHARTRATPIGSYQVLIRNIPHRIASTTAKVDAASIQKRPCFLCPANLPVR
jgi:hypothetical protein